MKAEPTAPQPTWRVRLMRDLALGLVGWFVINGLLWGVLIFAAKNFRVHQNSPLSYLLMFGLVLSLEVPGILNLIALLKLHQKHRWLVVGAVAAIVVNSLGILLATPDGEITRSLYRMGQLLPFFYYPNSGL